MRKSTQSIKNFADIHDVLRNFIPPIRTDRGAYTLERMQRIMEYLGNPQDSYKTIHVAGTSGKTSTCYFIANLLKQSGQKVGLTVSPHIDEINERVQINLKSLSEGRFCKEFAIFLNLIDKSKLYPTYFELLTAFAYWEFKRQGCEVVVVEVGLGGLLDGTNVIRRSDKIAVITDIGLDHEEVLGRTKARIASQKAGIIKPYNTVVCYEQDEEVMGVIRETADQQQADLHELWPLKNSELPKNLTLFQRRNWYLAYTVFNLFALKNGLAELKTQQLSASTQARIPARMEKYEFANKQVLIDGSHNQQKLEALVKSIKHEYKNQKFTILVSFVSTKQAKLSGCLEILLPICEKMIITSFKTENHEKVSIDPLKLVAVCDQKGFDDWEVVDDAHEAFNKLVASPGDLKLVTGSFYLLNYIRPHLNM